MDRILKIYKLQSDHWELKNMANCFEKINHIIDRHRQLNDNFNKIGITVPHRYYKRLHFHFYSFNDNSGNSIWKSFFPDFISQHHSFEIQTFSFILFIHNKENIFALVGGHGSFAIKRYVDKNFGLDIVSRVIKPNVDVVHLAELRGITGNIAGRTEAYREDQKVIDIDSFGKIFKTLLFEVSRDSLSEDFGVSLDSIRKRTTFIKSEDAFTLKLGRSFDEFCDLIHRLITLLHKEAKISLGTFTPIIDALQVEKSINIQLFRTIQERLKVDEIRKGELSFFDYDFCHPTKMLEFYECDMYQVIDRASGQQIIETENKNKIFELVINYAKANIDFVNLKNLMSFLGRSQVEGIKEGKVIIKAPFMVHLSCEIYYRGKNIYKIDDQWYSVKGTFVEELNEQCRLIFNTSKCEDILPETWINPKQKEYSEDWYNTQYLNYDGFIVLDKVLSQNIELCDLLFSTDDKLYCVHVKKGFNGMMRDLTNQVRIAARRLWIDINTDRKPFLNGVYKSLTKKPNWNHCGNPSFEDFMKLFNKEIIFVIAFTSMTKKERRVFTHIESFESNIAKYSLTETIKEMKNQKFPVKILEIEHRYDE